VTDAQTCAESAGHIARCGGGKISQAGCQIVAPVPQQDIKNEGASGDMYENKRSRQNVTYGLGRMRSCMGALIEKDVKK
jgi:hypothetical protein